MSQVSASSSKSEQSNIFSLSSNKSQKEIDENQVQEFTYKICRLLNVDSNSLSDLYQVIQDKLSNKFVEQKIAQFDQMLTSLNNVKRNNREMTKLISILGIRAQNRLKQGQIKGQNQSCQLNQKQRLSNNKTDPTEASQQFYNYKHKPISPAFNPFGLNQCQIQRPKSQSQKINSGQIEINSGQIERQKQKSYYDVYQQKNRTYEDKIRRMLDQLTSIKEQINPTISIGQNQRINSQKKQNRNQFNTGKTQKIRLYQTVSNKNRHQVSKQKAQEKQIIKKMPPQSERLKESLQNTNKKNDQLIEYARGISRKLQEIKAETNKFQQGAKLSKSKFTISHQPEYFASSHQPKYLNIDKLQGNFQANNQIHTHGQFQINQNEQNEQNEQNKQNKQIQKTQQKQQIKYLDSNNSKNENSSSKYSYSSQEDQFSIKNDELLEVHKHSTKKKSILDDMKNVESKVLISEKHFPHSINQTISKVEGTMIDIVNQNNFILNNHRPSNLVSHASVRNSLSDSVSQSSSKQVVISYLTMQQSSNLKKWQHNDSFAKIHQTSNTQQGMFRQKSSQLTQSQGSRKNSIHQISPVVNNFSNYHNTSIMNPGGSISINSGQLNSINSGNSNSINSGQLNSANSSVIRSHWQTPQMQDQFYYRQSRFQNQNRNITQINNQIYHSNSRQKMIKNERKIYFLPMNQNQPFQTRPIVMQNNSFRRINLNQPPLVVQKSRNSLPLRQSYEITPIKPRQIYENANDEKINTPKTSLTYSSSGLNINMGMFQDRFKIIENLSSFDNILNRPSSLQKVSPLQKASSLEKTASLEQVNKQSLLKNHSYISKGNTSFLYPSNNSHLSFNSLQQSRQNLYPKTPKNPFQELKAQQQQKYRTVRPSFQNQSKGAYTRQPYNSPHMSIFNSQVEPFITLGNSSKVSKDSRDSKQSRGSRKSKGLQLFSPNM